GDTIESVASEKAYVADGCSIVVCAVQPDAVLAILKRRAPALDVAEPNTPFSLAMDGHHQLQNAALALQGVTHLINNSLIQGDLTNARRAIESTSIPGRLQKVIYNKSTVWLDAAHNSHAVEALLPTLKKMNLDTIIVFTREDRSLVDSLNLLSDCADRVITDTDYVNVTDALNTELQSHPNGRFLVLGSFITVAAALRQLSR
ncbi:MAG TPA: cyanophycin synthetase, partial [Mariprofundaceae bacterium]|nr:cyanophycin synthetase [Mariprofundaceae bacterium]